MKTGTIVTPQGPFGELIVGIVTGTTFDARYVSVTWISDLRGIFRCDECVEDLDIASLSDRPDITDFRLNHQDVAALLATVNR